MSQKRSSTIYDFFGKAKKPKVVPLARSVLGQANNIDMSSSDVDVHPGNGEGTKIQSESVETEGNSSQTRSQEEKDEASTHNASSQAVDLTPKANRFDTTSYCARYSFDKQGWIRSLSQEERDLLKTEINYLHISWLVFLHKELTKPYFLKLKKFLKQQHESKKTIFPPENQIYSWSHLTPLPNVKCLILGQDPYHNHNQAHGLAFSVLEPTKPPPSLKNIYKTIAIDYPNFKEPAGLGKTTGGGNLSKWAERGVLMLNACLTVEAHKANSHAKHGWEQFTEQVIKTAVDYHKDDGFVIMAWGSPAQQRVSKLNQNLSKFLVLKTVHPSPLSASRGYFSSQVFLKCNQWLEEHGKPKIDWGLADGNVVM